MKKAEMQAIAKAYYARRDIQHAIVEFAKHREVVPCYFWQFGKRPDILQYESDVAALVEKNATSFHCSEELWRNPLELKKEMSAQQLNELRIGWDLLLDIDCKFFEYSKIAAKLLIEALKFHNISNFGLKFTGGKGFHILVPWKAFPKKVHETEIKNFFPEGPKMITLYLKEMIRKELAAEILSLSSTREIASRIGKKKEEIFFNNAFDPFSILEIDTILISSRHLFRMPYSLHEHTGLASIVLNENYLQNFLPSWARPSFVETKPFLKKQEENEAKELLIQAFDWFARKTEEKRRERKIKAEEKATISTISKEAYPPCIFAALQGMKHDGRKRALFILLSFFSSINISKEESRKIIEEWNSKNYKKLREGYIKTQLEWFGKQQRMPPNCDKEIYKDIGICVPDELCKVVKNPVNYAARKTRIAEQQKEEQQKEKKERRKKRAFEGDSRQS